MSTTTPAPEVRAMNPKFILNETNWWLNQIYLKPTGTSTTGSPDVPPPDVSGLGAFIIKVIEGLDFYFR